MKNFEYKVFEFFESVDGAVYAVNDKDPRYPHNLEYIKVAKSLSVEKLSAEYWRQVGIVDRVWEATYPFHDERSHLWDECLLETERLAKLERFAKLPAVDWSVELGTE